MSGAAWYQAVELPLPVDWELGADAFDDLMSGAMGAVMFLRALRESSTSKVANGD